MNRGFIGNDCRRGRAFFYRSLIVFIMTLKDMVRSKKFWTLVSAIVAALAAFFLGSCTARHYVVQSASSIKSGDTTRTTITYEQVGNFRRP